MMEELIAAIAGDMHVSQDGYDLKALREYLSQTIKLPTMPLSPPSSFHPLPSSRSTSSTRRPNSLPHAYYPENGVQLQAYPSPSGNMTSYFHSAEDLSINAPLQRPGALRRTSSYGFGGVREHPTAAVNPETSGFESDAFAPLYQQPSSSTNPWGVRPQEKANPWAAFSGQPQAFQYQQQEARQEQHYPQPEQQMMEDDDDAMDEDQADAALFEIEEEERVERAMGLGNDENGFSYEAQYADWERGRREDN